jgi:hypothetical protein
MTYLTKICSLPSHLILNFCHLSLSPSLNSAFNALRPTPFSLSFPPPLTPSFPLALSLCHCPIYCRLSFFPLGLSRSSHPPHRSVSPSLSISPTRELLSPTLLPLLSVLSLSHRLSPRPTEQTQPCHFTHSVTPFPRLAHLTRAPLARHRAWYPWTFSPFPPLNTAAAFVCVSGFFLLPHVLRLSLIPINSLRSICA